MHGYYVITDCGWVYHPGWTDVFTQQFVLAHEFKTDANGERDLKNTLAALRGARIKYTVLETTKDFS